MRKAFLLAALTAAGAIALTGVAHAASKTVTINSISTAGVGSSIGTLTLRDTSQGLFIEPKLSGLSAGPHGFHFHAKPDCGAGAGAGGQPAGGMAAGGHYDPKDTKKHLGPHNMAGHTGDLPVLVVDQNGAATLPVVAKRLKVSDVTGHAIMIHAGGDNFDDVPAPLGGGGGRIACGVVR